MRAARGKNLRSVLFQTRRVISDTNNLEIDSGNAETRFCFVSERSRKVGSMDFVTVLHLPSIGSN